MQEALVYKKQKDKSVRCLVCQRSCLISAGSRGFCLTKRNIAGKLYTVNYGLIHGPQIDPIEKKPFYHFLPGTLVPSIGSFGCNFHCKQCLNWQCSWGQPAANLLQKEKPDKTQKIVSPKELIKEVKKAGYKSIAFTYNEPVVWAEYVLPVAKEAKKQGLFTLFVTNGSWTKETLDKIGPYIDAANIDFKGFSPETYARMGAFFGQIPEMAKYAMQKYQIFLEITTLLIPGINDDGKELAKMTKWIVTNLSPKIPWHLSQFDPTASPDPEFQKLPFTPVSQLKKATEIGKKAGLQFVYIWPACQRLTAQPMAGRAPLLYYSPWHDTICPKCGTLCIRRTAWQPEILAVDRNGRCKKCRADLNIKFGLEIRKRDNRINSPPREH